MSETTERLDAIEARLAKATPGTWKSEAVEKGRFAGIESRVYSLRGSHILLSPSDGEAGQAKTADAEFIAAAPTDIDYLLTLARKQAAALERVEFLAGWWQEDFPHKASLIRTALRDGTCHRPCDCVNAPEGSPSCRFCDYKEATP